MKKLIMIIIMVLGLFIMPSVYAQEIPESGVRYVVTSPNGEQLKTFDLEEAQTKSEVEELVFEGKTDSNGEISLEEIAPNIELRVVDVKTNKEYTVTTGNTKDLTIKRNEKTSSPITKILKNPKTSSSCVIIILIVLSLLITTLIIKKKKKSAALLSVLLCVLTITNVNADNNKLKLVDSNGTGIKNQEIKIYAKPTLSFEEIRFIVNFDLSKTIYEWGESTISRTTFLDGSKQKQLTYKWDYVNEEWIEDGEIPDLTYIYSSWNNNQWQEYDSCGGDDPIASNLNMNYYIYTQDNRVDLTLNNSGKITINNTTNSNATRIDSSHWFQNYLLPFNYEGLLEDGNITVYQYQLMCYY